MNSLYQLPEIVDAANAVRSQARVRAMVGIPVMLAGIFALLYNGTSPGQFAPIALLQFAYIVAMLFLASRPGPFSAEHLAFATAILDPLILSAWLPFAGEIGGLFVGFYLFTILGYGFRTGPRLLLVCQLASIVGFSSILLVESFWRVHSIVWLSFLVTLVVVPLYAAVLVTKLHEARAHAERESQAKSDLLAKVSHELRTPLTGILAAAQLLAAETGERPLVARAETIMGLSRDLLREINDLLDQAKYEARALVLESTLFDLGDQMEKLRLIMEPEAVRKGLSFQLEIDPRISDRVQGDSHYLGKVLLNLVGNAIKFTHSGKVEVAMVLLDETDNHYRIRFSVADTGIGIPRELHDKIFDAFFQADSGTARKYGGTGLGMTIAKEIVNQMGGNIQVDSAPGAGSRFFFDLRLRRVRAREQSPEAVAVTTVYGKRVLVVDDNDTILTLFKEMLNHDAHDVVTATSGAEALEILSTREFDVLFLDFNMGDLDGAKVLQLYRYGRTQTAPAYFLTADATPGTASRLRSLGAAGVLHKPISIEGLRQAIAQVCRANQESTEKTGVTHARNPAASPLALATVPMQYVDRDVLEGIRTMSGRADFLAAVVGSAIADIERNATALAQALAAQDGERVRDMAHALKSVCASVGATRLETISNRLMRATADELTQAAERMRGDILETTRHSITALRGVLLDRAVNG